MTITELQAKIMAQAAKKGFGIKPENINVAEKIALIHSEVSEAFEAYRNKNIDGKDGFNEELGDVVARVLHLAGIMGVSIEEEMLKKLASNENRDWNWENLNEKHN